MEKLYSLVKKDPSQMLLCRRRKRSAFQQKRKEVFSKKQPWPNCSLRKLGQSRWTRSNSKGSIKFKNVLAVFTWTVILCKHLLVSSLFSKKEWNENDKLDLEWANRGIAVYCIDGEGNKHGRTIPHRVADNQQSVLDNTDRLPSHSTAAYSRNHSHAALFARLNDACSNSILCIDINDGLRDNGKGSLHEAALGKVKTFRIYRSVLPLVVVP